MRPLVLVVVLVFVDFGAVWSGFDMADRCEAILNFSSGRVRNADGVLRVRSEQSTFGRLPQWKPRGEAESQGFY